jgi:hypothetical protein
MEALYERERIDRELRFEYMQRIKMEKEDIRSLRAAEYVAYLELLSQNSSKARKRKEDLIRLKREEALKKVEDRLALQRAQRLEDRRKKAFEVRYKKKNYYHSLNIIKNTALHLLIYLFIYNYLSYHYPRLSGKSKLMSLFWEEGIPTIRTTLVPTRETQYLPS